MNVLRLVRWLTARGHHLALIVEPESPLHQQAASQGLEVHPFTFHMKYGDLPSVLRLARFCRRRRIDILVLHTNRQMCTAVLTRLVRGSDLRLVYMQHMHLSGRKLDWFHRWEYRYLDAWIAPLPLFADRAAAWTSVPRERIVTIPFGIEVERFGGLERTVARQRLGLPGDVYLVGVVGRLDPKKGQDTLVRAARLLHDDGIPAHVLLVGDPTRNGTGDFVRRLHALVAELDLRAFVHFRPHMEEIAPAYAALDVFALTSHSETYGMVTLEAMATGLPVVGTGEGGTVEIIVPGETGLLVPPEDPEALAAALEKLYREPELRSALGAAGRRRVREEFSHHTQCDRLEALFRKLRGA